jgi:N-acetylglutamate synthase-like GNAT family acetyltransferase
LPASTPVIRFASEADGPRILELVGRLGHAVPVDAEAFAQAFPAVLADHPRSLLHVAEVDGVLAGYALTTINPLLYTNGPSAQLQEIVVDDRMQTSGVGTALVRAVEKACEESGVTQLTVASRRAGGFYDRLGYTQQAEYMRRLFT